MLTKAQEKEYLANNGERCPYCSSASLRYGDFEYEAGGIEQQVECQDCRKSWSDEYNLTGITENED